MYFENSLRQRRADQDFIRAELKAHGFKQSTLPHKTNNAKGVALDREPGWYGGDEARHIADILASFQTPAGGWSKNTDFTTNPRTPGEMFGAENGSLFLGTNDFDQPQDASWSYVGTFDNDATTTELRFLVFGCVSGLVYVIQMAVAAEKNTSMGDEGPETEPEREPPTARS